MTLQEFIDWIREKFEVNVTMVMGGGKGLYNSYLSGVKHKERLPKIVEEVYTEVNPTETLSKNYLILMVNAELVACGTTAKMPKIKYTFG